MIETPTPPRSLTRGGVLYVLLAAVLWGTTGTAQALAPISASSASVGAVRLLLGGVALLLVLGARRLQQGAPRVQPPWPLAWLVAAVLSVALYQQTFFAAVRLTGVAVGTMVAMGSTPVFAGLLDGLWLRQPLTRRWYAATALALAGLVFLSLAGDDVVRTNRLGIGLALLAGLAFAGITVANRRLVVLHTPLTVVTLEICLAALLTLPILLLSDLGWLATTSGFAAALHLGLVTTALAYVLFSRGLQGVAASSAATLSLAEPLTAALLGLLLLHELMTPLTLAGMALILLGLLLLTK